MRSNRRLNGSRRTIAVLSVCSVLLLCALASSCDSEDGTDPAGPVGTGAAAGSGGSGTGGMPDGGGAGGSVACAQCETLAKPGCCPTAKASWQCTSAAVEDCQFFCNGEQVPANWPLSDIKNESLATDGGAPPIGVGGQGGAGGSNASVEMRSVMFKSWQWDQNGQKTDIDIHGIIGVPQGGSGPRAALLILHGLNSQAGPVNEGDSIYALVKTVAQTFDVVAMGISAPGVGESTGTGEHLTDGDKFCNLFSTDNDVRASWLYSYAVAAMRAVTYLSSMSTEVHQGRIGLTGSSIGGAVALLVNGIDSRVKAVIPVSGAGDFAKSVQANSWIDVFLDDCVAGSASVKQAKLANLSTYLDPIKYAQTMCGAVFLINGAHDEAFPLDATQNTYEALDQAFKSRTNDQMVWWNIVPDLDHGYYATENTVAKEFCTRDLLDGDEWCEMQKVSVSRALNGMGFFMYHFVNGDADYDEIPATPPQPPSCTVNPGGGAPTASCSIEVAANMEVEKVRIWFADKKACMVVNPMTKFQFDDEYFLTEDPQDATKFTGDPIVLPDGKNIEELVYWSEVSYKIEKMADPILFCGLWSTTFFNHVFFSSTPVLPANFTPAIRPHCDGLSSLAVNPCDTHSCDPNPGGGSQCVHLTPGP